MIYYENSGNLRKIHLKIWYCEALWNRTHSVEIWQIYCTVAQETWFETTWRIEDASSSSAYERSFHSKGLFPEVKAVIDEYFDMGHAEPVPESDLDKPTQQVFYLPIHAVMKSSSTTTKVRAVFDENLNWSIIKRQPTGRTDRTFFVGGCTITFPISQNCFNSWC